MASGKFKGIWPMYGGKKNYVLTLRAILKKICDENPTINQLVSWLKSEYKGSSDTVSHGVLRVVSKCLGFAQEISGRVSLTSPGEEFFRTGENRLVLDALLKRVLGFDEILLMLAETGDLSIAEINKRLVEKFNLDWRTTTQTMYRLFWLSSLGFVAEEHGKYHVTKQARPPEQPQQPILATGRIDDYLKHATALIERHPAMNESNTISTLIEPLLEVLGWNIRDPDEVQRGYQIRIGDRMEYVDIALKINNRPVVFIEAKAIDTSLQDHLAEQPIKYANAEGVSWCVLTNGREFGIYNAFWKIRGIEQKTLFKLSTKDFKEKLEKLMLLSREKVASGKLDEEGELEHAKRIIFEWMRQEENSIVKDIMRLDPSLKEDYVRQTLRRIS